MAWQEHRGVELAVGEKSSREAAEDAVGAPFPGIGGWEDAVDRLSRREGAVSRYSF